MKQSLKIQDERQEIKIIYPGDPTLHYQEFQKEEEKKDGKKIISEVINITQSRRETQEFELQGLTQY